MTALAKRLSSSFRDPSGFLFKENGILYRAVSQRYQQHYDYLIQSKLYDALIEKNLLISHREIDPVSIHSFHGEVEDLYKIIKPECVPFISYPYEWCFSQYQDAALTTIKIQKQALVDHGMVLKDASAYNIQFYKGKPLLIDTLSFEIYKENKPWIAYRQFCQHFLAPLALMALRDIRLGQLMRIYIDGLPLDLASLLLPKSSWLKSGLLTHIHLHAKTQKRYEKTEANTQRRQIDALKVTKNSLVALINHLEDIVSELKWSPVGTEWADYYEDTNYSTEAMNNKKQIVDAYLSESNPQTVWDLGANTGVFSHIAAAKEADTIAFDVDPAAVEKNYRQLRENKVTKILPLCLDLTNPSPAIGWANEERFSLIERGPADVVLALALIHHLAISNNVPLGQIAAFLSKLCQFLIIEFVPKDDSQVQRLLSSREDIFDHYTKDNFEQEFSHYFLIQKIKQLPDTLRILYLMRKKEQ